MQNNMLRQGKRPVRVSGCPGGLLKPSELTLFRCVKAVYNA